ncbi:MAG: glycoside hydrolase, partial [Oscillospiraceae bacterium]|nr:glycoside hydrolase [Oscillospiraceae bacterium]
PMVAELESGRILVVFRGSNVQAPNWKTRIEPGAPGFKWYSYSDDGGKTFTNPAPWHFDDGEVIYSSATISYFLRANSTGKLYWMGNMTSHHVNGNYPRWPLNIVEVDEKYGTAKKESFTVIDTKRDWESADLQLSNFNILEDRESGDIELWLAKIGQYSNKEVYRAETWKYRINIGGC